jgi:hypothetical protein
MGPELSGGPGAGKGNDIAKALVILKLVRRCSDNGRPYNAICYRGSFRVSWSADALWSGYSPTLGEQRTRPKFQSSHDRRAHVAQTGAPLHAEASAERLARMGGSDPAAAGGRRRRSGAEPSR